MHAIKMPIYQTEQIRQFERLASERFAVTGDTLMQRAGRAATDYLQRRWPHAKKIVVFCGNGNNGGDGYVLAEQAQLRGLQVTVLQVGKTNPTREECQHALLACQNAGVTIEPFSVTMDLHHTDLVVDAICGIGLKEDLRRDVVSAIEKMEHIQVPIFAMDVPTGIDADTGNVMGAAVHAAATMTFIGLKLGLLTGSGIAHTGEVICNDLQLPAELFESVNPVAETLQLNSYLSYLKPRARDWHKGLSGHVLIIGGDVGYSGAPRMAAEAALRVGAGLVTVLTHPAHAATLNIGRPEIMCRGIIRAEELQDFFAKAQAIVLGVGLGQSDWSQMIWNAVIGTELPLVVDADGLNLLAKSPRQSSNWILTPHPGEAARLLGISTQAIQQNRLAAIKQLAERYQGVSVLKGSGSFVLAKGTMPVLCDKGNPGMATAGTGDVLSGVIGGLLGQRIPLAKAAKLGVCLHAMAGDLSAKEGERGMIATDLMPYLRRLANTTG